MTSRRASVTAGNIANASTPGYVRRELLTKESILGSKGQGVQLVGIERAQDQILSRERRHAGGSAARADVLSRAYNDLNREMGMPGDSYGLFNAYQNVETNLRELAVTPESTAYQKTAFNSLNALTVQFGELQTIGINQRINADNAIARSVRDVNESIERIVELNNLIASSGPGEERTAAFEDERQIMLDKISQIIPIKDLPRDGGAIDIITEEGVFLLSTTARKLEFNPAGIIPPGAEYDPSGGLLSGLTVDGENLTPGVSNLSINSGALAGYFTVRDSVAPDFLTQLDTLAADLIDRFSGSTVDPTNGATSAGIFTDNGGAVDPANLVGLAGRLRVNAAIDPSQGGDVARLRDGLGSTTAGPVSNAGILNNLISAFTSDNTAPSGSGLFGSFNSIGLAAGISSLIGEARVSSDALAASTFNRATVLNETELAQSAVDTDQEMQTLLVIEQAYAANARVIQTVSELLDILMRI